jgi:hypothetical protein
MENKIENYPEVIGDEIVNIEVKILLEGVDLERTKRDMSMTESIRKALRLFYSYSHKDEELRDELETHLKLMQRQGLIESWHDRRITAGDEWKKDIDENLERADIILLLVSADFIASDYCYDIEMERALERHDVGEAVVIPVIIRDVNWKGAPFSRLGVLPEDGKAVATWGPDKNARDTAWRNVSEGIERAIDQLAKRPSQTDVGNQSQTDVDNRPKKIVQSPFLPQTTVQIVEGMVWMKFPNTWYGFPGGDAISYSSAGGFVVWDAKMLNVSGTLGAVIPYPDPYFQWPRNTWTRLEGSRFSVCVDSNNQVFSVQKQWY